MCKKDGALAGSRARRLLGLSKGSDLEQAWLITITRKCFRYVNADIRVCLNCKMLRVVHLLIKKLTRDAAAWLKHPSS